MPVNTLRDTLRLLNPLIYFDPYRSAKYSLSSLNTALGWFFAPLAFASGVHFLSSFIRGLPSREPPPRFGGTFPELLKRELSRRSLFQSGTTEEDVVDELVELADKAFDEDEAKKKKSHLIDDAINMNKTCSNNRSHPFLKKTAQINPLNALQILFYAPARLGYSMFGYPLHFVGGIGANIFVPGVLQNITSNAEKLLHKTHASEAEEQYVKSLTKYIQAAELLSKERKDLVWRTLEPDKKRLVIQKMKDLGLSDADIANYFERLDKEARTANTERIKKQAHRQKVAKFIKSGFGVLELASLPIDAAFFTAFSPILSGYKVYAMQPLLQFSRGNMTPGPAAALDVVSKQQENIILSDPSYYEEYLSRLQQAINRGLERAVEEQRRVHIQANKWIEELVKRRKEKQKQEESNKTSEDAD